MYILYQTSSQAQVDCKDTLKDGSPDIRSNLMHRKLRTLFLWIFVIECRSIVISNNSRFHCTPWSVPGVVSIGNTHVDV